MSLDHIEYQGQSVADGAGQSTKSSKVPYKKRNVVVDDQHPFDLDVHVAQYEGQHKCKVSFKAR